MLAAAGWRILARNLRTRWIELDLLAVDGADLVAVEVKGRGRVGAPERCVSGPTQLRMRQALRALRPFLAPAARGLRVDVVAVTFADPRPPEVRHFRGLAFPSS
jgi:putative endonuclease